MKDIFYLNIEKDVYPLSSNIVNILNTHLLKITIILILQFFACGACKKNDRLIPEPSFTGKQVKVIRRLVNAISFYQQRKCENAYGVPVWMPIHLYDPTFSTPVKKRGMTFEYNPVKDKMKQYSQGN